jgi:hypothetical protein
MIPMNTDGEMMQQFIHVFVDFSLIIKNYQKLFLALLLEVTYSMT